MKTLLQINTSIFRTADNRASWETNSLHGGGHYTRSQRHWYAISRAIRFHI